MYNFSVSKETYKAVVTWLEALGEYDSYYERSKINEIKTRRIEQKAHQKTVNNDSDIAVAYMNIEPKEEKEQPNLNFEMIMEYVQRHNEDIEDSLEELSETISYFTGTENENSIDFLK